MKSRIAIVVALMIAFTALQGCTLPKGGNETSSAISESSSAPPSTAPQINTNYEPLKITDYGSFIVDPATDDYDDYDLHDFILLLKQKNIPIVEIAGTGAVHITGAYTIQFQNTQWDHVFSGGMDSPYDTDALAHLLQKQEIQAVYVKTPYEIFTFLNLDFPPDEYTMFQGNDSDDATLQMYDSNVIITTNPRFATEKGIKIGDSFAAAAEAYGFSEDTIVKKSDADWSVWDPDDYITFYGSKDGISSIELGCPAPSNVFSSSSNHKIISALSVPPGTASKINMDYEPLKITDDGCFKEKVYANQYDLHDFILLLKERNIPILEVKGAGQAHTYDCGGTDFKDTNWNYAFSGQMTSPYDVNFVDKLTRKQNQEKQNAEIDAVYVKTPYEIYCFGWLPNDPDEGEFSSDMAITANPRFVTEKGIKIGDSFAAAARVYNFTDDDIIKASDSDWCVWVPYYGITFYSTKDGITAIELGDIPITE